MVDDQIRLLITRLIGVANELALSNHTERGRNIWERSYRPQPGDWVVERTHMKEHGEWHKGTGRLIAIRHEELRGTWEEDSPRPMVKYTYIENLDGTLARWENCSFVAAPITPVDDPSVWVIEAVKRHGLEPKVS